MSFNTAVICQAYSCSMQAPLDIQNFVASPLKEIKVHDVFGEYMMNFMRCTRHMSKCCERCWRMRAASWFGSWLRCRAQSYLPHWANDVFLTFFLMACLPKRISDHWIGSSTATLTLTVMFFLEKSDWCTCKPWDLPAINDTTSFEPSSESFLSELTLSW